MDDKDRAGEARGAEDALDPRRPGGERKETGETDQRPDPANSVTDQPGGMIGEAAEDSRAAGTVDDPIPPGDGFSTVDYQTGDRNELAAQRGGPVDVSRDRAKRG